MLTVGGCEQKVQANRETAEALAHEEEKETEMWADDGEAKKAVCEAGQQVDMRWPGRGFYEENEEETEEEEDHAWDELDVADSKVQTFATTQKSLVLNFLLGKQLRDLCLPIYSAIWKDVSCPGCFSGRKIMIEGTFLGMPQSASTFVG